MYFAYLAQERLRIASVNGDDCLRSWNGVYIWFVVYWLDKLFGASCGEAYCPVVHKANISPTHFLHIYIACFRRLSHISSYIYVLRAVLPLNRSLCIKIIPMITTVNCVIVREHCFVNAYIQDNDWYHTPSIEMPAP